MQKYTPIESKFKFLEGTHPGHKFNVICDFFSQNQHQPNFYTYRFIIGTPSKERFENLQLSEAATESNFIRSNGRFIAVRK